MPNFTLVTNTQHLRRDNSTANKIADQHDLRATSKSLGVIPSHLAPLLDRLGVDVEGWCDVVKNFGKLFKRAAGCAESIAHESARRGLNYMHAPGAALLSNASG